MLSVICCILVSFSALRVAGQANNATVPAHPHQTSAEKLSFLNTEWNKWGFNERSNDSLSFGVPLNATLEITPTFSSGAQIKYVGQELTATGKLCPILLARC